MGLYNPNVSLLVTVKPEILRGVPVFAGTRVPVRSFFKYLETNYTLDEFLECFPTVTREMAEQLLDESERALPGSTQPGTTRLEQKVKIHDLLHGQIHVQRIIEKRLESISLVKRPCAIIKGVNFDCMHSNIAIDYGATPKRVHEQVLTQPEPPRL